MKIKRLVAEKHTARVEGVSPSTTLRDTARRLIDFRIGALVVTDAAERMVGIVSERDLLPVVAGAGVLNFDTPVSEVMTRSVITCGMEDEVSSILRIMNANAIRHIPVTEDGKLVDMISIRELTKAYELLQKEADTDPLTELSNRRPFLRTLETEFSRAKRFKHPLSVALLDIDHFKQVNDTYGHDAGDRVLRGVSTMLINEFRTIDLVGRLGGEEFAVIFPETGLECAQIACERLLSTIQSTIIPIDREQISVTASIGLAGISPAVIDGTGVLKKADELLYVAKNAGRNRVVVEEIASLEASVE